MGGFVVHTRIFRPPRSPHIEFLSHIGKIKRGRTQRSQGRKVCGMRFCVDKNLSLLFTLQAYTSRRTRDDDDEPPAIHPLPIDFRAHAISSLDMTCLPDFHCYASNISIRNHKVVGRLFMPISFSLASLTLSSSGGSSRSVCVGGRGVAGGRSKSRRKG